MNHFGPTKVTFKENDNYPLIILCYFCMKSISHKYAKNKP